MYTQTSIILYILYYLGWLTSISSSFSCLKQILCIFLYHTYSFSTNILSPNFNKLVMDKTASSSSSFKIQPPSHGNLVTILSIDGGGVRGIIPGVILAYLESQLQVIFLKISWNYFMEFPKLVHLRNSKIIKAYCIFGSNQVTLGFVVVGARWRGSKACRLLWCSCWDKYRWSHCRHVSSTKWK